MQLLSEEARLRWLHGPRLEINGPRTTSRVALKQRRFCDFYLRLHHREDQLLHTLLPNCRLPLLARDHHEIVATAAEGDHGLVRVCEQRIL